MVADIDLPAAALTTDRNKLRMYHDDVYFRESLVDFSALEASVRFRILASTSFILFKPEAIVGRRVELALEYLQSHGFDPTGALSVRFNRHTMRAMWWYQLNAAPLTVIRAVDMIIEQTDYLFVTMSSRHGEPDRRADTSAARRLSDRKGSSRDVGTGQDLLREALSCTTQCINYVHVPDEPADMVRELGILFDPPGRARALSLLADDGFANVDRVKELMQVSYGRYAEHHLDRDRSVDLLLAAGARDGGHDAMIRAVLHGLLDGGSERELLRLIDWIDCVELDLARWDRIVIAAHLAGAQRALREPMIGPPAGSRARARRAEVLAQRASMGE